VDLDPGAAAEYVLAPDGASYRTVRNPDRQKGGRVEVQEVSLDPARPGTRPVAGEPGLRGDLTAGGRVLLVMEKDAVAASEVPSGRRLWRRAFGPGQGVNYPVGSVGGEVVVVIHENFRVTTLDGKTGEPLPPLEGVEQVNLTGLGPQNVSAGGWLVAFTFSTLPDFAAGNPSVTIGVWNVRTGQRVQSWRGTATVAFHPTRPVLAVLEPNGDRTRLGLWDFAAQP
jgi:hypothetical protein